jgi:hypothetical protein
MMSITRYTPSPVPFFAMTSSRLFGS